MVHLSVWVCVCGTAADRLKTLPRACFAWYIFSLVLPQRGEGGGGSSGTTLDACTRVVFMFLWLPPSKEAYPRLHTHISVLPDLSTTSRRILSAGVSVWCVFSSYLFRRLSFFSVYAPCTAVYTTTLCTTRVPAGGHTGSMAPISCPDRACGFHFQAHLFPADATCVQYAFRRKH